MEKPNLWKNEYLERRNSILTNRLQDPIICDYIRSYVFCFTWRMIEHDIKSVYLYTQNRNEQYYLYKGYCNIENVKMLLYCILNKFSSIKKKNNNSNSKRHWIAKRCLFVACYRVSQTCAYSFMFRLYVMK